MLPQLLCTLLVAVTKICDLTPLAACRSFQRIEAFSCPGRSIIVDDVSSTSARIVFTLSAFAQRGGGMYTRWHDRSEGS